MDAAWTPLAQFPIFCMDVLYTTQLPGRQTWCDGNSWQLGFWFYLPFMGKCCWRTKVSHVVKFGVEDELHA